MWQLLSWDQWLILATGPLAIYCSQSKLDIGAWASTNTGLKMEYKRIKRNAVRCATCKQEIESKHRHDFKFCKCGAVGVDGGKDYLRRIGDFKNATELSEYEDE